MTQTLETKPRFVQNNSDSPELFFPKGLGDRSSFNVVDLNSDEVYGFNIGKDLRNNVLLVPRHGVTRVVWVCGQGEEKGQVNKGVIVLSPKNSSKLYLPSGYTYAATALTEEASFTVFSDANINRTDFPKILDPLDPDMNINWKAGKIFQGDLQKAPHDNEISYQRFSL